MSAELVKLADELTNCAKLISSGQTEPSVWSTVEDSARQLADRLRSHGEQEDYHEIVGATALPHSLTTLITHASEAASTQPAKQVAPVAPAASGATYEILRVGANICMDHDINRGRFLAAGFPQIIVGLLDGYSKLLLSASRASSSSADLASALSLVDLKIIKTSFGVLLNAAMDYKPVKDALSDLKASGIILRLTSLIYPAGLWKIQPGSGSDEELSERWTWRWGLSDWSWRALETLRVSDEEVVWDEAALPYLAKSLASFSPTQTSTTSSPHSTLPSFAANNSDLRYKLLGADVNVVEETCMLIEGLAVDEPRMRELLLVSPSGSTASSTSSTTGADSPFYYLLTFVEHAAPPPEWATESRDAAKWEKTLGMCKAAVIKAIVTVAGEDSLMDTLWGTESGGGWFVQKMVEWIKRYPETVRGSNGMEIDKKDEEGRDDLVICATLCLGNVARRESRCLALVEPPISILPALGPLLDASTDLKLKHGVLGLLRNLAQGPSTREALGKAGIIPAILKSKVWSPDGDKADVVQISAVATMKNLVNGSIPFALQVFEPLGDKTNGLDQLLELIRRTDSLAIRNESTRILVNLVKTLFVRPPGVTSPVTNDPVLPPDVAEARKKAFNELCTAELVADAIAEMLGRNLKYPVLLNEGIVALTLLASHAAGVPNVVAALTSNLGPEGGPASVTRSPPISEASLTTQSTMADASASIASSALDMLTSHILSPRGKTLGLAPELRANACLLLLAVGRADVQLGDSTSSSKEELAERVALVEGIRAAARPVLTALTNEQAIVQVAGAIDSGASPPVSPAGAHGPSAAGGGPLPERKRDPNVLRNAAIRTLAAFGSAPAGVPSQA
ncbi:hypothetical protein DL93DRAFT_169004 [Clavulina sp. PMI_390]|nr:hypothetical protein DL93DRAFT_169004 [Clavulina sp. PMI_390]